jgi:anti-sigma factor RsiW
MKDNWTDRLSEYLDEALTPQEREGLERHLGGCTACRDVLADLGLVVDRARALPDRPPARDLWAGIAQRIGASPEARPGVLPFTRRRFSFTVPQLAAAAVVLMLLAGGLVTMLVSDRSADGQRVIGPRIVLASTPSLDAAVAELEQALLAGRGRLDTTTVRIIEKNLAIIDRAIAEAQIALARDPANTYLNRHLTNQKLRKLDLLRQANELAAAQT